MTKRLLLPRPQAVGLDGRPLAGAKIYTYETGTATPKPVWTDAARTVAHANPVVADAAGRWPAMFMSGGDYRTVLEDAAGTVIATDDPVEGDDAAGGEIALVGGASGTTAGRISGARPSGKRWQIDLGDTTAETGANSGSAFTVTRYSDAGSLIGTPVTINRATGAFTLTGDVSVNKTTPTVALTRAAGTAAAVAGQTGGLDRWRVVLGNSALETGSNAGSAFEVQRFNDAGTLLDAPITIARDTGRVSFTSAAVDNNNPLRFGEFNTAWATALRVLSVTDVTSGVAQVDIPLPAGWSLFQLLIGDVRLSAGSGLNLRTSIDGTTFAAGASDYTGPSSFITLSVENAATDDAPGMGQFTIFPGAATTPRFSILGWGNGNNKTTAWRLAAGRQQAIRILPGSGNINRATIRLIGVQ